MADITGIAAYRFVVDRVEHKDSLRCEVVPEAADLELVDRVRSRLREGLRFDVAVSVVNAIDTDGPTIVDTRSWD